MGSFLLRLIFNAIALYVAVWYLDGKGVVSQIPLDFGASFQSLMATLFAGQPLTLANTGWLSFLGLALIFGFVNALIKPILTLLTCPLLILTLGLGTLLINTAMFYLAGNIGTYFNVGFTVSGFWPAFWGALIVSVISILLTLIFGRGRNRTRAEKSDR